ncbi:MAG: TerC family protein [Chloroflexi bacterium]|nr:MAG: TerC family protein [Chloroflexota bacterium]
MSFLAGLHLETWIAFNVFIFAMLMIDLFVLHRNAHVVSMREAAITSAGWIALGLAFGVVMWWWQGPGAAGEYFADYLIEKSLSVDNVFIFVIIFSYFAVPAAYQHRVLFWGVVGALLMRGTFIIAGTALLSAMEWVLYLFGAFLLYTAFKMFQHSEMELDPRENKVLRLVNKIVPLTQEYDGQKLFTRINGVRMATPLFAVLVVIDVTDLVFAVDSIPAVFAVTRDPFIVYTSNAFAILGLRALYFLLAGAAHKFVYLKPGLAIILAFVGIKMLIVDFYHVPVWASLVFIGVVLTVALAASLLTAKELDPMEEAPLPDPLGLLSDSGEHEERPAKH